MEGASSRSQMTNAIDGGPGWHIDSATLLPVLDDEAAFRTKRRRPRAGGAHRPVVQ